MHDDINQRQAVAKDAASVSLHRMNPVPGKVPLHTTFFPPPHLPALKIEMPFLTKVLAHSIDRLIASQILFLNGHQSIECTRY